jgi:putative aldouronate transport system permease protein
MAAIDHNDRGIPLARSVPPSRSNRARKNWQYFKENWLLFVLGGPGLIFILLFNYLPLMGNIIAFQDYSPRTLFASPWVGFRNFRLLTETPLAQRLIVNTLGLNILFIAAETACGVTLAIFLNEVKGNFFRRIAQSFMFLPYFMGWTVVAMVLFGFIDYQVGTVNAVLGKLGLERIAFTTKPAIWPLLLMVIRIWKNAGAQCIIYLAALTSIDSHLYEAAAVDGANRWQRIRFISLPALTGIVILLTLLAIGRIFYGDVGMIYALIGNQAQLYPTTDVIDTYLLRALQVNSNYGFSAAIGLLQSFLGLLCVVGSNWLAKQFSKRQDEDYGLF